jgi:hypothetical protein
MNGRHRKSGCLLWIMGFVAFMLSLLLMACSDPPTSGYVTHKQHSDAYTYTTTSCVSYITVGTVTMCASYQTNVWTVPASWELCLRNNDDPKNIQSGCLEVGESTWHKYQEGQHFPDNR